MISRRNLVTGAGAGILAAGVAGAANALTVTPAQTPGPFFPDRLPGDSDFDLVQINGGQAAAGEVIEIQGRVLGADGRALPGAVVELWQANAYGRYAHSRDTSAAPLDPNFQGYGVVRSDAAGNYRFRTIKPGLYTGRTRHLHFYVAGPGFEKTPMQMYFEGDATDNTRDFLYASLGSDARKRAVTVGFSAGVGTFDIVMGV